MKILWIKKFENLLNTSGQILPISVISGDTYGALEDGLDPEYEKIGDIFLDEESSSILLKIKTIEGDQKIWLISWVALKDLSVHLASNEQTIASLATTDNSLLRAKWKGAPLSDWLIIVLSAIIVYLLAWLFTILLERLIIFLWKNLKENRCGKLLKTVFIPLRLVIAVSVLGKRSKIFRSLYSSENGL